MPYDLQRKLIKACVQTATFNPNMAEKQEVNVM